MAPRTTDDVPNAVPHADGTEPGRCGEFWERRYRQTDRMWTGAPNGLLVREIESLPPTTALDLGCGEGGDALWLAGRGWRVTAVDVAPTALARAAQAARAAGVADRVTWLCQDLADGPPPGSFGLVTALFLHSPVGMPRGEVLRAAAARVAPGGTLLVVGHSGAPSWQPRETWYTRLTTPDDVLAELGGAVAGWSVDLRDVYEAPMSRPNGQVGFRVENALRLARPV
ncbi:class I SAM-dependent methyltransferase [Frankia sp. EI5c]|uniref:class I SAM-dependent methyltransferase n=1 Tax=Frankia sp. EI5c TaxID=683316 RepID=UPI001F5B1ABF|nr:class I SAM-dependent methyltransferase [Frankia sp. EI5c]